MKKRQVSAGVSSKFYRAPEISLVDQNYSESSDMWSFGCILFEFIKYHSVITKTSDS